MNKYIFREKINLLMQILLTILLSCFLVVAIVSTKRLFEVQNKTFSLIVISVSLILFAGINYLKDRTIYNMGLSFVEGFKQDLFHNVISQNFFEWHHIDIAILKRILHYSDIGVDIWCNSIGCSLYNSRILRIIYPSVNYNCGSVDFQFN